jgi:hypothetical protein
METLSAEQPVHERAASLLQVNRWDTRQLALWGLASFAVAERSPDGSLPSVRLIVHQIGSGEGYPSAFLIGDPDVLPPLRYPACVEFACQRHRLTMIEWQGSILAKVPPCPLQVGGHLSLPSLDLMRCRGSQ